VEEEVALVAFLKMGKEMVVLMLPLAMGVFLPYKRKTKAIV
jgi:hypothetical protein